MDEEKIPTPKQPEPVKGEVLLAFLDKNLEKTFGLNVDNCKLLSLSNLSVNLYLGNIYRKGLSFLPCLSYRLNVDTLVEHGIGTKDDKGVLLEGEWEQKDTGKMLKVFEMAIGEEKVFFIDSGSQATTSTESSHDPAEIAKKILVRVLEAVKDKITCTYSKYFVNNSLIVEEGAFVDKDMIPKLRAELYTYINAEIKKEVEMKTQIQEYLDNFEFRPFYGAAIMKLPKYKSELDRFDWDDLYINVEQTKKELNIL